MGYVVKMVTAGGKIFEYKHFSMGRRRGNFLPKLSARRRKSIEISNAMINVLNDDVWLDKFNRCFLRTERYNYRNSIFQYAGLLPLRKRFH